MTRAPSASTRPRAWKVVEVATVTDEELERALNEWTRAGWLFEGMQFAMRESSRRPSMCFLLFTRDDEVEAAWTIVNRVLDGWAHSGQRQLAEYAAGTWGPAEAHAFIEADGRRWRRL